MLKTCSKRDLLWLEDGEGADLSLGERSVKNSQGTLRDLRFGEGESEREHLCSWVFLNEVVNHLKWMRGSIYSPKVEMAVGAIGCTDVGRQLEVGHPKPRCRTSEIYRTSEMSSMSTVANARQ